LFLLYISLAPALKIEFAQLVLRILMYRFRYFIVAAALAVPLICFGQKESWLPITEQEKSLQAVPGSPGAEAIQLYYADYIDDNEQNEFFYKRIKILNEKGNKYADVEIEIPPEGSVTGLKARTIHPDGSIVEFAGKPFQKTIAKTRGVKFIAKTFTMPEVTPGSIIEYKYKIEWPGLFFENFWIIQHDLYTLKEDFRMKPYQGLLDDFPYGYQISASYARMPRDLKPQKKGDSYEMQAHDIPGFAAEGYMPPESDFKPQVRFYYLSSGVTNQEKFWEDQGRSWQNDVDRFIGNHKEVSEAAAQAIAAETEPEKKLRKLYARAQQIRNLSYERDRNEQELKRENIKSNQNAGDVVARGYGFRNDITRSFVALSRAAGFEAWVVRVSNRKERFFDRSVLSRSQLQDEIALVNAGGKEYYLDPATPFCPFGLLRWVYTSSAGLKVEKKIGPFITVPAAGPGMAVVRRIAKLALSPDGSLKGELVVEYSGADALELRLDAISTDDAGRQKSLEDEISSLLPRGAAVKVVNVQGWNSSADPLKVTFSVEIANFVSSTGKRILMPSYFLEAKQLDAFKHSERKYPVYFPYAFAEMDNITIKTPMGYIPESVPPKQDVRLPYAGYQSLSQFDGSSLNTQRVVYLNGILFPVARYSELKDFFSKVQAGDEQQVVFHGGSESAQK
jgi:uncharacterized protein DUF3857